MLNKRKRRQNIDYYYNIFLQLMFEVFNIYRDGGCFLLDKVFSISLKRRTNGCITILINSHALHSNHAQKI